jgi:hypothetical protein
MIEIREYLDAQGRSRYAKWFSRLDAQAAAKVAAALIRMEVSVHRVNSRCIEN